MYRQRVEEYTRLRRLGTATQLLGTQIDKTHPGQGCMFCILPCLAGFKIGLLIQMLSFRLPLSQHGSVQTGPPQGQASVTLRPQSEP